MHIERNICESLLKLLFGAKDTAASRRDMEEEGIREHLWIRRGPNAGGHYFKPPAPYVLKKEEQKIFLDQLDGITLPTGYCGPLKKHLIKNKIGNMKSHDFHIFFPIYIACLFKTSSALWPKAGHNKAGQVVYNDLQESYKCWRIRSSPTLCSGDHVPHGDLVSPFVFRHYGTLANTPC
jgi:hypothetical protein